MKAFLSLLALMTVLLGGLAQAQQTILPIGQREAIQAAAIDPQAGNINTLYNSATFPHDWTEGAGTLGANGEIDIPAPATGKHRRWIYIQNQGTTALPVYYEARRADGVTQVFGKVMLVPAASAGAAGGSEERGFAALIPQGIIKVGNSTISALDNQQVTILEIAE